MRITKKSLMLLLFLVSIQGYSQQCDCGTELIYLVKKVEINYPGYRFEVSEKNRKSYENFKSALLRKARQVSYDDCYFVLKMYAEYFHDGHLAIGESPVASPEQIDSLKKNAKYFPITAIAAQRYYTDNSRSLDPVEGIWKNQTYTIAIRKTAANKYLGSILSSENKNWQYGQVKVALVKKGGNRYQTILYNGNHLKTNTSSSIWKTVLMNVGPYKWVKVFPKSFELDHINLYDPEQPTLMRLDTGHMLLTLPSFLIGKSYLDSLLAIHDKELRSTKNLIIDLRGNIGGNMVYQNLLDYLYTNPMKQFGSKSIANEDNMDYFKRMVDYAKKNGSTNEWASRIYKQLENNKGGIADVIAPYTLTLDSISSFPKRVAIITDRSNASSAEAFLKYYSKQSTKVIQFGDRTAGVLDYGSTNGISLSCPNGKYVLYYPIFFENNLPQAGINKTGISPDVRIPENIKDKIAFVKEYLKDIK